MDIIKDALKYALNSFEQLHNTQTYHGDNQDFSDEIITMRAALAELEQHPAVEPAQKCHKCGHDWHHDDCVNVAPKKPAQAVPVYEYRIKNVHFKNWSPWEECEKSEYDQYRANPKDADGWMHETRTLYTVPPAIDDETRSMVLELLRHIDRGYHTIGQQHEMATLMGQIRKKLEAGK